MLEDLTTFYKIFADKTRLEILTLLQKNKLCVNDISIKLNKTQSLISHQLKILRDNNLVKYEKRGQSVIYSIIDNHINIILKYGIEHLEEKKNYEKIN